MRLSNVVVLPVPAPATLELLKRIPCYSNGIKKELTTPTGAALISHFADEYRPMPNMNILGIGYGAGKQNIHKLPNYLRIIHGEIDDPSNSIQMKVIETNIDDMNPEFYEHIMDQLFGVGAVDVFLTPIYMKKNRPGTLLSVLTSNDHCQAAIQTILTETSTFGVRYYDVERSILNRSEKYVKTTFGKIRVKIGSINGSVLQISPEYNDCKKIATRKKIPVKTVYDEALELAKKLD